MILFLLIISVLLIAGIRQPAGNFGKEIVTVLKPILAIGIVLHHCSDESVILYEFKRWGPLIVGIFFFISGYGLTYSVEKNMQYLKKIIVDKIFIKLLLPCLIVLLLHISVNCSWRGYSFIRYASIVSGPSFFPNDWFMYALMYCYLVFKVAYNVGNKAMREAILIGCIFLYETFTMTQGYGRHWYSTPLAFYVGHIYRLNEPVIISFLAKRRNLIVAILCNLMFLILMFYLSVRFESSLSTAAAYTVLPLLTVMCVIRLNLSRLAANRFIIGIGAISFEIYLVHGVVMSALHQYTELQGIVFAVMTLLITLPLSAVVKSLTDWSKLRLTTQKLA